MIFVAGNRTTFYGSTGIFLNGFPSTPCFAKILMKNTIQIHNIYHLVILIKLSIKKEGECKYTYIGKNESHSMKNFREPQVLIVDLRY